MPIYEYECSQCGRTFEVLQKIHDAPLQICVLCSGGPIKKRISASAFVLKGTGFYVNDYPSEGRRQGSDSDKSDTSPEKSNITAAEKSEGAR